MSTLYNLNPHLRLKIHKKRSKNIHNAQNDRSGIKDYNVGSLFIMDDIYRENTLFSDLQVKFDYGDDNYDVLIDPEDYKYDEDQDLISVDFLNNFPIYESPASISSLDDYKPSNSFFYMSTLDGFNDLVDRGFSDICN